MADVIGSFVFGGTVFSSSSISKVVLRGSERDATAKIESFRSFALGVGSTAMSARASS
jgi:hypothetical protein